MTHTISWAALSVSLPSLCLCLALASVTRNLGSRSRIHGHLFLCLHHHTNSRLVSVEIGKEKR